MLRLINENAILPESLQGVEYDSIGLNPNPIFADAVTHDVILDNVLGKISKVFGYGTPYETRIIIDPTGDCYWRDRTPPDSWRFTCTPRCKQIVARINGYVAWQDLMWVETATSHSSVTDVLDAGIMDEGGWYRKITYYANIHGIAVNDWDILNGKDTWTNIEGMAGSPAIYMYGWGSFALTYNGVAVTFTGVPHIADGSGGYYPIIIDPRLQTVKVKTTNLLTEEYMGQTTFPAFVTPASGNSTISLAGVPGQYGGFTSIDWQPLNYVPLMKVTKFDGVFQYAKIQYEDADQGYDIDASERRPDIPLRLNNGYSILSETVPLDNIENFMICHKQDGHDILSFDIPMVDVNYSKIKEESRIIYGNNNYLVKKIQDGSIVCGLDFDFMKERVYYNYSISTKTLGWILSEHLPTGWTIVNANLVTISRSMEFKVCTDYDVIMECSETFDVYFVWELGLRRVTVYYLPSVSTSGEYITDELNLRNLSFSGETTALVTRLYPYGKDGLTIESVNGGLPYVENFDYSRKIVCGYWTDERYTNAQSLMDDALTTLAIQSRPVRNYECDIVDLAKLSAAYDFLDFVLHKKITLIEGRRKVKVVHQICEYMEYPAEPIRNKVTLAAVPLTIQKTITNNYTSIVEVIETTTNWLNQAVIDATNLILSAVGGYVLKRNGELLIMDTEDVETATKVWRWNLNGLGYSATGYEGKYALAMTMNGEIVANMITAGVLRGTILEAGTVTADKISQSYKNAITNEITEAKESLTQSFEAGDGYLLSQINATVAYIDESLVDYVKGTELLQTVDDITASFSQRYSGGMNLLKNSAGINGVDNSWTTTGTVQTQSSNITQGKTVSNSRFRLSATSTLEQQVDDLVIGRDYMFSCKLWKSSSVNAKLSLFYGGAEHYLYNDDTSFAVWTEYELTIENIQTASVTLKLSSTGDHLYIADAMLADGNMKRSWTPSPNELYTTNVKIDKNGLSVTNNTSGTRTVINNEEFAVYNGTEKVITVNQDETRLKKSIVDADLSIGKLKFLPLADYSDGVNVILLD